MWPAQGWVHDRKKEKGTNIVHDLTHFAVCFEGVIEVTEPDLMCRTVSAGIGPAKAFGFGLLSLAKAES
jgi:CRISPR system Cascade subunit CasE